MHTNQLLDKIKGLKVAVIGDMMIDETLDGISTRMSPEAPVPVIDIQGRTITPGGAANVAMNVAALGAHVTLFTQPGDDRDSGILVNRMTLAGVKVVYEFDPEVPDCFQWKTGLPPGHRIEIIETPPDLGRNIAVV